jgi:hypothetical protein
MVRNEMYNLVLSVTNIHLHLELFPVDVMVSKESSSELPQPSEIVDQHEVAVY